MKTIYSRPKALLDAPTTFCPGCNHSTIMRLIAEVLEEMNLLQKRLPRSASAVEECSDIFWTATP